MNEKKEKGNGMRAVATFVVDKRYLFFLLYVFALIFCLFSRNWVQVENDVTAYLPADTETRQGLTAMNENFLTPGSARVMVSNVTYETAQALYEEIAAVPGVASVTFDGTEEHYRDAAALYDVTFSEAADDEASLAAVDQLKELLAGYDLSLDTMVGFDATAMLRREMGIILLVAAVIIVIVLSLTSRAWAEVPVLLLTFAAAALLNMGTNFFYGKISFVSDAIATVLQLALAIDYAIILCHRFSDEHEYKPTRDACIDALSKAIPEISASSLTTICGLAALGFMQFGIGFDMAIVLIKSILFSLTTVFTLMPGLLMEFSPLIDRTRHRKLLPDITPLGKLAVRGRYIIPPLFAVVLVGAFWLANQCPYCYDYNDSETARMTEQQTAHFAIKDRFGVSNMVALVVPAGDYEAEKAILADLEARPEVKSAMGLANIQAMDGYTLADSLTPRAFSEMAGLDYEVAKALYGAYALEQDQYGQLLSGLDEYAVPLFDLLVFLKDSAEDYNLTLTLEDAGVSDTEDLFDQIESAQRQLKNDRYSRLVLYLNLPVESDETFAFLDTIREVAGQYYEGDYYVVGDSTSARDLAESFVTDNLLISILSALFVIAVLLFTFRSAALPVLLIVVIQGSIWINFSIPTLTGQPLYFLGYLIVNAIQMGANIDYAIVISSHYQEQRALLEPRQAILKAVNAAFPTVFTSGGIMAAAGLLIGNLSTQPVIAIMGNCLGRGTIISIVLVLGVLPSILVLGDRIIERTSFQFKGVDWNLRSVKGTVRVRGHVRGYVSGFVDGNLDGILHGQLNATLSTDGQITPADEEGGDGNHA